MEKTRVLLIEDYDTTIELVDTLLRHSGRHRLVKVARSMPEAIDALVAKKIGRLSYDVIVMTGNIQPYTLQGENDCRTAREITDTMSDLGDETPTVSIWTQPVGDYGIEVTHDLGKEKLPQLISILDKFPPFSSSR